MPAFARAKIAIQISNYLRNNISKQQINTNQNKLKDRIRFIFYIAFASKMGKSIRKKKRQWTETHKKKLRHLSQQKTTKVKTRFTEKMIHNFSNYALSEEEKQALSYRLDEYIPVKLNENKIETGFKSFHYNIMQHTGHLRQNEQNQLKSKIRRICEIPYRCKETIKKLSNNKDIIILRQDKGRDVVVINRTGCIEKCSNILTSEQFKAFENDPTKALESKVQRVLRKIKHFIDEKWYKSIYPTSSKPGLFYETAKTHKLKEREGVDKLTLRPIICNIGTAAYEIARYLTESL